MRLMHNIASLNIYRNYNNTLDNQSECIDKISSGYKINRAKQNENDLAKSERMRMQIRGISIASRNVQDNISMLQTAGGGIDNMSSILQRLRELGVEYNNDTNTNNDKEIMKKEMNQLIKGYNDICENTEFNGKAILKTDTLIETAIGSNVGDVQNIKLYDLRLKFNGKQLTINDFLDNNNINLTKIDHKINKLNSVRSKYGALENKFSSVVFRNDKIKDNIQAAESKIRDVDISKESIDLLKDNILIEAANAMMVQTNKFPQEVLKILENVRK